MNPAAFKALNRHNGRCLNLDGILVRGLIQEVGSVPAEGAETEAVLVDAYVVEFLLDDLPTPVKQGTLIGHPDGFDLRVTRARTSEGNIQRLECMQVL